LLGERLIVPVESHLPGGIPGNKGLLGGDSYIRPLDGITAVDVVEGEEALDYAHELPGLAVKTASCTLGWDPLEFHAGDSKLFPVPPHEGKPLAAVNAILGLEQGLHLKSGEGHRILRVAPSGWKDWDEHR